MKINDVLTLVSETFTVDEIGQRVPVETTTEVFCSIGSVTQSEFFAAGKAGLNAEYRADIFAGDYNGEKVAEFRGVRYGIYRTYLSDVDRIELYLERKAGLE